MHARPQVRRRRSFQRLLVRHPRTRRPPSSGALPSIKRPRRPEHPLSSRSAIDENTARAPSAVAVVCGGLRVQMQRQRIVTARRRGGLGVLAGPGAESPWPIAAGRWVMRMTAAGMAGARDPCQTCLIFTVGFVVRGKNDYGLAIYHVEYNIATT